MIDRLLYAALGLALLAFACSDKLSLDALATLEPTRAWELSVGAIFFMLLAATGIRELLANRSTRPMGPARVIFCTVAFLAAVYGAFHTFRPEQTAVAPVAATEVAAPVAPVELTPIAAPAPPPPVAAAAPEAKAPSISNPSATSSAHHHHHKRHHRR